MSTIKYTIALMSFINGNIIKAIINESFIQVLYKQIIN